MLRLHDEAAGVEVKNSLNDFPCFMVNLVTPLDESEKWYKLQNTLFLSKCHLFN